MSTKNILIYTLLSSLLILISTKEENSGKFLSFFDNDNETDNKNDNETIRNSTNPDDGTDDPEPTDPDEGSNKGSNFINIKCLFSKGYNIYSLQPLQKEKDYELKKDGYTLIFNFCKNTEKLNTSIFVQSVDNKLVRLAGSIDGEGNNKNVWNEIKEDEGDGISIEFVEGDECYDENNKKTKHSLNLRIYCDADIEKDDFLKYFNISSSNTSCNHIFKMRSIHGCTLRSMYLLLKILKKYNYVFCVLFVLIGIIFCFFGNRYINKTIIIIGGVIGCYAITALVLSLFPKFITTELYLFVCLFVSFVLGCVIGYFLKDDIRFSCLLLGGSLGFSCATFVYQIVQNYVEFDPEIVYYGCIGVCIVVGAFIGWKLYRYVVIIGTAVLGGYLVMRGISLVAEHYLDESLAIDLLKNKEWDELKKFRSSWIYAYLGTWIILSVVGTYYQWKHKDDKKKKRKKDIESK